MTNKNKILFICKKRHIYSNTTHSQISSGLTNSAQFVVNMLNHKGIHAKLVEVIDNNCIDKEVTLYKPTHVIIEALWVTPDKFEVLQKLHPNVKWIIRLHSEIPFLANEGIAVEWLYKYIKYKNVYIGANSENMVEELGILLNRKIYYLPNYYPTYNLKCECKPKQKHIDIGCFGAIRPLKNQLIQAVAAIEFGNEIKRPIHFHINATRIEGKGESILKNIENLFINNPQHKLVKHEWMSHKEFLKIVRKMELGMQVSFSETFNIVAADFVNNNIPIIVSDQIFWASDFFKADPNSVDSIKSKLKWAWKFGNIWPFKTFSKTKLEKYNINSKKIWLTTFS